MDCNSLGASIHGIIQVKILEWVATSSSRGSSRSRDWTWVACHLLNWQAGSLSLSHLGSQSLSSQPQGRGLTARELLSLWTDACTHLKTFLRPLIWSKGPGHMEQVLMATSYITFWMGWQAATCSLQCPNTYAAVCPASPQSKLSRKEKTKEESCHQQQNMEQCMAPGVAAEFTGLMQNESSGPLAHKSLRILRRP